MVFLGVGNSNCYLLLLSLSLPAQVLVGVCYVTLPMVFFLHRFPFSIVDGWKEGIGEGGRVVDEGKVESGCLCQGLAVYAFSTDDENLLLSLAMGEGFFQGGEGVASDDGFP